MRSHGFRSIEACDPGGRRGEIGENIRQKPYKLIKLVGFRYEMRREGTTRLMEGSAPAKRKTNPGLVKFIAGGVIIAAAVIYLIVSSTKASAQYYMTIDELAAKGEAALGRNLRISGAVDGTTIAYDSKTLTLQFTMVNVPGDMEEIEQAGGLARVLHEAVSDPRANRLQVVYVGPLPDLLRDEAQAIVTGSLGEDGIFRADELLLKCPTRYEEELPGQAE
jgi:cytochrome c-type biogenesis protein CcmE